MNVINIKGRRKRKAGQREENTPGERRTAKVLEAWFRAQLEEMDIDWSRSGLTIEERVEVRKAEFSEWLDEEYGIPFWFGKL